MIYDYEDELDKLARLRAPTDAVSSADVDPTADAAAFVSPPPQASNAKALAIESAFNGDDGINIATPPRKPLPTFSGGQSLDARNEQIRRDAAFDLEEQAAADFDTESRRSTNFGNGIAQAIAIATRTRAPSPIQSHSKLKEILARRGESLQRTNADRTFNVQGEKIKTDKEIAEAKAKADWNKAVAAQKDKDEDQKETAGHHRAMEEIGRTMAGIKATSTEGDKRLPVSQVVEQADFEVADKGLQDLFDHFKKLQMSGIGARLSGAGADLGFNTEAALYKDKGRAVGQVVGKILEGGKLAAGDELKYARMLPQPGDTLERAQQKITNVQNLLRESLKTRRAALAAQGYKGQTDSPGAQPSTPAQELSDKDKTAEAWAKAHPDDPRSAAILETIAKKRGR